LNIKEAINYIEQVSKLYGYTEKMLKPFMYDIREMLSEQETLTKEVVDKIIENLL
jgi:hypothetical protein